DARSRAAVTVSSAFSAIDATASRALSVLLLSMPINPSREIACPRLYPERPPAQTVTAFAYGTLHLPGVVGQQGELDAVVQPELLEHPRHVGLDRRHAHEELASDLGVRLPEPDGDRDLALPLGEPVELRPGVAPAIVAGTVRDVVDQPLRDRWRQ